MKLFIIVFSLLGLVGCSRVTFPTDVQAAEKVCSANGGFRALDPESMSYSAVWVTCNNGATFSHVKTEYQ